MNTFCLNFENVSKSFDLRLLYKNVNFTIYPADIVLLTGKNGSGKSTLLKLAAGLSKPSKGKISYSLPPEQSAYLGHATFLYPQLTAFENLEFWIKAFGLQKDNFKERILQTLKLVNLHKFADDTVNIFSRGMAQRLNIARIILQDPSFLLLDEPCTGLDLDSKAIFYACIDEFKAKNACILWVSHDLQADKKYANKFMHIEDKSIKINGEEMC